MSETAKRKISTKDLAILPVFSVLTAVGAFIRIPIGVVPVSLQTVFVVISALLLGKKAFYAQLIYVLLGLLGLPVFTGGGGIGYVFTPTFGYLLGFMAAAYFMGALREKTSDPLLYETGTDRSSGTWSDLHPGRILSVSSEEPHSSRNPHGTLRCHPLWSPSLPAHGYPLVSLWCTAVREAAETSFFPHPMILLV